MSLGIYDTSTPGQLKNRIDGDGFNGCVNATETERMSPDNFLKRNYDFGRSFLKNFKIVSAEKRCDECKGC